jgi:hypothetical protein
LLGADVVYSAPNKQKFLKRGEFVAHPVRPRLDLVLNRGPSLLELAAQVVVKNLDTVYAGAPDRVAFCLQQAWHKLQVSLAGLTSGNAVMKVIENGHLDKNGKPGPITLEHFHELQDELKGPHWRKQSWGELPLGVYGVARLLREVALVHLGFGLTRHFRAFSIGHEDLQSTPSITSAWFDNPENEPLQLRVKKFYFTSCQLVFIPQQILKLSRLKELSFENNELDHLPDWLQGSRLTRLTYFVLASNQFHEIPPSIGQFTQLKKLKLARNQISLIAKEVWCLNQLTLLNLSYNRITQIAGEISQLRQLTYLDFSYNEIQEIPTELGDCNTLQQLHFGHNRLTKISTAVLSLGKLQICDLSSNQLTEIPASMSRLTALQQCHLEYNQIQEIPRSMRFLTNLKYLDLAENPLKPIPEGVFANTVEVVL